MDGTLASLQPDADLSFHQASLSGQPRSRESKDAQYEYRHQIARGQLQPLLVNGDASSILVYATLSPDVRSLRLAIVMPAAARVADIEVVQKVRL